jgi:hypothetical protein
MGLTRPRAEQISDLDYKQATRTVTTSNITLTGGAPAQIDSISLTVNDRVLVTGQDTASQNGIYDVVTVGSGTNGTWVRTSDANATGEIQAGMIVMVTEGAVYADTQWKLITDNPIAIGTTALVFTQNYSANSISGGTSNVTVYSNSSVTISSAGMANVVTVTSGTVTITGNLSVTGNTTIVNTEVVNQTESVVGNVIAGNVITNTITTDTGDLLLIPVGNISVANVYIQNVQSPLQSNDAATKGYVDSSLSSVLTLADDNTNTSAIAAGDTITFNQVVDQTQVTVGTNSVTVGLADNISVAGNITGKNLNSSHADLAEMYVADADYPAGTVVEFGGNYEITVTHVSHSTAVAGIISTNPSYLMNSLQTGQYVVPVALTGRVPCRVVGIIAKGDRLVTSGHQGVAQSLEIAKYQPGCIVGKALENYNSAEIGIIEVAVGRT